MRAEAASWDDWSVSNPPPVVDTDKWHVQFAPDEVKVVSLEQLDDLFRLSIVDSETQVWQTGMSEWQPLRVIAGLDEQPAPIAKRAPPKPPSPPTRTVVMAKHPAPPSPHAAMPSVRPAPPAARPVSLAPASFYPEPIQARASTYPPQVAYAAPVTFAAPVQTMNSVRPLVVSHVPPMTRGGGGFGRFLVGLALLSGVAVTAYRNDLLRGAAHEVHQDALYARLESALGGPAFGTLRSLEQSVATQPANEFASSIEAPVPTGLSAAAPASPSTPTAIGGAAMAPVVSLESIAPEQKGQAVAKPPAPAASPAPVPVAVTPPPARAAASFVQPKPVAAPVKAAPARASAPAKPAPERPAPAAQKSASEMSERERLNAAIGQSMMQADAPKSKSKAKAKGNEYDPLNPTL
ncbi:MAG TPA: GYF domain-containing protein [Polyangiaceae bacterium]|nr:GYF domain-containing protein [Polyangiaceae bacterium]HYQ18818.1 GYF domain-containing protein [Polyangiaceae bacterium]